MSADLSLMGKEARDGKLGTVPDGGRQLGKGRTQQTLETPPLNDDDD